MTDPALAGPRDDEGRDVRAALGGLLVDEPTAPWSVQDDVRRGQALRTRRRTRVLGTVGVVAALALMVGVLGQRGPWSTQQVVGSSPTGLDEDAVSALLEQWGWDVTDVASPRTEPSGPAVTKWSVSRSDSNVTAALTVRTWDATSWPQGSGDPRGSVFADCRGACGEVAMSLPDCAEGPCWDETSATLDAGLGALEPGTGILRSRSEFEGVAVELAAGPVSCVTCSVALPGPFLTLAEQRAVLALVQQQLLGRTPSAPPAPGRACTSDDVKLVPGPDPALGYADAARILVTVYPRNPAVDCTLTPYPTVAGLDRDGAVLQYGQDNSGLAQSVHLGKGDVALFRVAAPICAPVGGDLAALRVALPGGGDPLDVSVSMLVPLVSCAVGATPSSDLRVFAYEPVVGDPPAGDAAATPKPQDVVAYLGTLDITATGGPDFAGSGTVGAGSRFSGTYRLRLADGRTSNVTVRLVLGTGVSPVLTCQGGCTESTRLDPDGVRYSQTVGGLSPGTPDGVGSTFVVDRSYGDASLSLVVDPWSGSSDPPLSLAQLTLLADAFASDCRAAVGVPVLPVRG